jgi:RNA recognition motif-containing protein
VGNQASDARRLYVGNIQYEVTKRELHDAFAVHVGVEEVELLLDKFTNQPRGFGFVTLVSAADAEVAISALDGVDLRGRKLKVSIAKPREDRDHGRTYRERDAIRGRN